MKKILICVDLQNDFVTGVLGSEYAQKIVPNVVAKIEKAIKNEQFIIFTKDLHYKDYLSTREGRHLPIPHCLEKTPGQELIQEVRLLQSSINKEYTETLLKDSFGNIELDENLMEEFDMANEVVIIGVATNLCVLAVALTIQNWYPNLEITIDASCCASYDPILHEKALDVMEGLQFNVINR